MLLGCLLIAAAICYAQIRGSIIILSGCLLAFLLFAVLSCDNGLAFPVLLFFLPWSPLLKLYNGGISLFTIALLLVCVVLFLKNRMSFRLYQIVLTAVIMALTLTAKVLQGNSVENSYLCFLAMLLLFPSVVNDDNGRLSFFGITAFFACGIISAALSAQQVAGYANISQYIRVDSYLKITRLSGYYGDPNFYSAHITACLAGVQLLLIREESRGRRLFLAVVVVALVYCGLLSASKSFIVVSACLFLVWIPVLLEKGNRGSHRFRLIMGILCAGVIILSSSAFRELLQIIDARFAYASNVAELTTGRTELWLDYLNEFTYDALLTFFGEGYTNVVLHGRASHNTIIQGIFQFGIIGFPLVLAWVYCTLRNRLIGINRNSVNKLSAALMCVGFGLPWMGIDILFFDEFFLLPVYAVLAIAYFSERTHCSSA